MFQYFFISSQFSPKTPLIVPSLYCMLSLIFKTTCVVFLETFVILYLAERGFHFDRNHRGDLYDH